MTWLKRLGIFLGGLIAIVVAGVVTLFLTTSGDYPVSDTVVSKPNLPSIEIDGIRLHAQTFGDPSAPIIIVLHGGPGNDHRSLLKLKELAASHLIVFYDQRGAGLSQRVPAEKLTLEAYLEELTGVIEHFAPDTQVTLIGHSWGAILAAAYLGHAPEKISCVVLMEPGYLNAAENADWRQTGSRFMSSLSFLQSAIWTGFEAQHVDGPDADASNDYLIGKMAHLFANHPDNSYHCPNKKYDAPSWRFGATANSTADAMPTADLDRLDDGTNFPRKILFLAGICNDWIGPDLQLKHANMFANAQLEVISASGHEMVWNNPDATLAAIREFLRSAPAGQ